MKLIVINCRYWSEIAPNKGYGACAHLDQPHGKRPSRGTCLQCSHYVGPAASVTEAVDPMPAHLMKPVGEIPADYVPTPENATRGGCGCKK